MIYYLLLTFFAIRATQLFFKGHLVTVLGVNLNDPSFDSGSESAEHIPTLNSAKDALEIGSDGAGGVGVQLTSSVRGLSGVTMADMWRLTTQFSGEADPISSNLEQVDSPWFDNIGGSMSVSSGVFTFPSTGLYFVIFNTDHFDTSDVRFAGSNIQVTTDGGSTFVNATTTSTYVNAINSNNTTTSTESKTILNVSDVSQVKTQFRIFSQTTSLRTYGDTDINRTYMTFIRLGDL